MWYLKGKGMGKREGRVGGGAGKREEREACGLWSAFLSPE